VKRAFVLEAVLLQDPCSGGNYNKTLVYFIHRNVAMTHTQTELTMNANDIALTQVDTLGFLLAQIKELTDKADAIKDTIKDTAVKTGGAKKFEGNLFTATVVEADRKVTDWKAIAKVLGIPADLIAKHTDTTAVFSVKTTSR
jgi:hypothetical protein